MNKPSDAPHDSRPVGCIGLGLLGSALAERLLRHGYRVLGFDRDPARVEHLIACGGEGAATAADVSRSCRTLVLCLPDSSVVAQVIESIEGDLSAGHVLIDTTTGDPEATAELGARLDARGIDYLDATVAGSSQQARQGAVLLMVGGRPEVLQGCGALLECFSDHVTHLGPWGSGARMKLVFNLVLGLNRAVLAEGLALARACGLDLERVLQLLRAGPAHSAVMDTKGSKMIREDFVPQARLAQHLKDVRLIQELARRVDMPLPLSSVHERLLETAAARGYAELDNSAVIKAYLDVPPA